MTPMDCEYHHRTGFSGENSWKPGRLLQFVFDSTRHRTVAVVLPYGSGSPFAAELVDIRINHVPEWAEGLKS